MQRLKFHITGVHEGVKYNCTTCNSSFTHKSNMNQHIKKVHEEIKPFTCDICDKSLGLKNHLKRHILEKHGKKNELLSPTEEQQIVPTFRLSPLQALSPFIRILLDY